jgi:thioredoxin-related protein
MRTMLLFICFLATLAQAQWAKTPLKPPAHLNPNLYPANADAKQEIAQAIAAADKENKRVLLVFGGNWCLDCHVLENAFQQPRVAPVLKQNFKVVHVDIGEYDKNLDIAKKYHIPLEKGVPSVAVLNRHGERLYSSTEFEKARGMSEEDVIAFLDLWKPPSQKQAIAHAK